MIKWKSDECILLVLIVSTLDGLHGQTSSHRILIVICFVCELMWSLLCKYGLHHNICIGLIIYLWHSSLVIETEKDKSETIHKTLPFLLGFAFSVCCQVRRRENTMTFACPCAYTPPGPRRPNTPTRVCNSTRCFTLTRWRRCCCA